MIDPFPANQSIKQSIVSLLVRRPETCNKNNNMAEENKIPETDVWRSVSIIAYTLKGQKKPARKYVVSLSFFLKDFPMKWPVAIPRKRTRKKKEEFFYFGESIGNDTLFI